MNVEFERVLQGTNESGLTEAQLLAIEKDYLSAPLKSGGSFGPIGWDADFSFDEDDIKKSYAYLKLTVLGFSIVDTRLDAKNPKISVDLTVAGVGVTADIGIDFEKRKIYFKGILNFIFYKTAYDFTILNF